jgi:hypothetical protein
MIGTVLGKIAPEIPYNRIAFKKKAVQLQKASYLNKQKSALI